MATTSLTCRSLTTLARGVQTASRTSSRSSPSIQSRALSKQAISAHLNPNTFTITGRFTRWRQCSKRFSTPSSTRRAFSASSAVAHGDWSPPKAGEELYITFIDKDGVEVKLAVSKGDNLLDIAQANDIEMEGACGGSCACSTCHVIVDNEDLYDKMPEPSDDENDMLDLAFGLTETSRLGCQVVMDESLDGIRVKLPSMTRNLQASDFSKKNERSD